MLSPPTLPRNVGFATHDASAMTKTTATNQTTPSPPPAVPPTDFWRCVDVALDFSPRHLDAVARIEAWWRAARVGEVVLMECRTVEDRAAVRGWLHRNYPDARVILPCAFDGFEPNTAHLCLGCRTIFKRDRLHLGMGKCPTCFGSRQPFDRKLPDAGFITRQEFNAILVSRQPLPVAPVRAWGSEWDSHRPRRRRGPPVAPRRLSLSEGCGGCVVALCTDVRGRLSLVREVAARRLDPPRDPPTRRWDPYMRHVAHVPSAGGGGGGGGAPPPPPTPFCSLADLSDGVKVLGLERLAEMFATLVDAHPGLPAVSVGSGAGVVEGYMRARCGGRTEIVCVDPQPASPSHPSSCASASAIAASHRRCGDLVAKRPELVGRCLLLLVWPLPHDDGPLAYDIEAVRLLRPRAALCVVGSCGAAGSSPLLRCIDASPGMQRFRHHCDLLHVSSCRRASFLSRTGISYRATDSVAKAMRYDHATSPGVGVCVYRYVSLVRDDEDGGPIAMEKEEGDVKLRMPVGDRHLDPGRWVTEIDREPTHLLYEHSGRMLSLPRWPSSTGIVDFDTPLHFHRDPPTCRISASQIGCAGGRAHPSFKEVSLSKMLRSPPRFDDTFLAHGMACEDLCALPAEHIGPKGTVGSLKLRSVEQTFVKEGAISLLSRRGLVSLTRGMSESHVGCAGGRDDPLCRLLSEMLRSSSEALRSLPCSDGALSAHGKASEDLCTLSVEHELVVGSVLCQSLWGMSKPLRGVGPIEQSFSGIERFWRHDPPRERIRPMEPSRASTRDVSVRQRSLAPRVANLIRVALAPDEGRGGGSLLRDIALSVCRHPEDVPHLLRILHRLRQRQPAGSERPLLE
jgi:hypothetical protein